MRISVDKTDLGYREDWAAFSVTLDGQELKRVVSADEERGEVVILQRGEERFERRVMRGRVQVFACSEIGVGVPGSAVEVPDSLRAIMLRNSNAADEITTKSAY